jgi:hypothetical protein
MTCLACDGDGWVPVAAGYAERIVPDPSPARLESVDPDRQPDLWAHVYLRRESAARSVAPCKVCRPGLYLRWAGGHLGRLHNTAACETCSGPRPSRQIPSQGRRDID